MAEGTPQAAQLAGMAGDNGNHSRIASPLDNWESLTQREKQVSLLAIADADRLNMRGIGGELGLSRSTVNFHLGHARAKMGVKSTVRLAFVLGTIWQEIKGD